MPYAAVHGVEIYYEEVGTGAPLLFLHSAFSRGILSFAAQYPTLQSQFRCIMPDLRGHGRSRSREIRWTAPRLADEILAFLDALGIPATHAVGHSLGAAVALYGAARHPGRFKSLTLIGTAGRVTPAALALADEFEPQALEHKGENGFLSTMAANHGEAHGGDWRHFLRQSALNFRRYPNLSPLELQAIRLPCLLIAGENDPLAPAEEVQRLAESLPDARVEIVPGCGHRPHLVGGRPELVNSLLLRFLTR